MCGQIYGFVVSSVYTPPLNVTEMVPRAPKELTTGRAAKNVPVNVKPGFVAESTALVGFTITLVDVPTRPLSVAQVSVAAKLA
jgi:hypothetical protein